MQYYVMYYIKTLMHNLLAAAVSVPLPIIDLHMD